MAATIDEDSHPLRTEANFPQPVHEDIAEGMDRMMDEGGGVVEQNVPIGAPIARNDLVQPTE